MAGLGRVLIVVGLLVMVAGGLLVLLSSLGLGRLPGNLEIRRGNLRIYIPLASSLLVSVLLTLLLNLLARR